MWGTLFSIRFMLCQARFIPTHVGNTSPCGSHRGLIAVHPHACGEHPSRPVCVGYGAGSSPRMWGTLNTEHQPNHQSRFIPTHVGNTHTNDVPPIASSVHPHACGEHSLSLEPSDRQTGSSPRMWGTHRRIGVLHSLPRFIPTHVGNTSPLAQ